MPCSRFTVHGSRAWALALIALAAVEASAQLQVTLTATDHHGYHISCFGGRNGAIDAMVSGGTPPYTYYWSNGASTEDLQDLASGLYILRVADAANAEATTEITLTEPVQLKVTTQPFVYPGGTNVSCHDCFNGSIDVSVSHGVPPYAYAWEDGPTTPDRSGLGALSYRLLVTDANGCELRTEKMLLTQPERDDWRMEGNAGTDPATQYIGTSDAQDVVLKTNGEERLRLLSDGDIKLFGGAGEIGPVFLDADGVLKIGGPGPPPLPQDGCVHLREYMPYWKTEGNSYPSNLCPGDIPVLGTLSEHPLRVITNDVQRMIITTDGRVAIGTELEPEATSDYKLFVEGGIATRDVLVKLGDWPDYVFQNGYHLPSLAELKDYLHANNHLPGIPSAAEVDKNGGVEVGDLQKRMLETIEQQALYILQLEERMKAMEQRLNARETSR